MNQTITCISSPGRRETAASALAATTGFGQRLAGAGDGPPERPAANTCLICKHHQDELCIESIPRSIYVSSRQDNRSLRKLKDDFRRNLFDHKKFNKFYQSKEGAKYFMGVTKSNEDITEQIKEAIETEEAAEAPDTSSPVREDPEKLQ